MFWCLILRCIRSNVSGIHQVSGYKMHKKSKASQNIHIQYTYTLKIAWFQNYTMPKGIPRLVLASNVTKWDIYNTYYIIIVDTIFVLNNCICTFVERLLLLVVWSKDHNNCCLSYQRLVTAAFDFQLTRSTLWNQFQNWSQSKTIRDLSVGFRGPSLKFNLIHLSEEFNIMDLIRSFEVKLFWITVKSVHFTVERKRNVEHETWSETNERSFWCSILIRRNENQYLHTTNIFYHFRSMDIVLCPFSTEHCTLYIWKWLWISNVDGQMDETREPKQKINK